MHEIDLKNYKIRTDLIIENFDTNNLHNGVKHNIKKIGDIFLEETEITEEGSSLINKKKGLYKTISFKDVTDKTNYKKVQDVFIEALKTILIETNIKEDSTALVVGLGNDRSTPDALGPNTINNVLVTRYLFELGEVEEGYRNVACFKPNVTGTTGIETKDLIESIVTKIKPDFLIVIDALASSSINRLNKTIQITNTGIEPGSGVGNTRDEISKETLNIPVIVIGVPTIVDAATIVSDTFKYIQKQISYKIDNQDNKKLKFVTESQQNYENHITNLTKEEKKEMLGIVGTLTDEDFKTLIYEVLSPINYNLMVTPKEIDFVIEKLSLLIGNGINKVLHKSFKTTNY